MAAGRRGTYPRRPCLPCPRLPPRERSGRSTPHSSSWSFTAVRISRLDVSASFNPSIKVLSAVSWPSVNSASKPRSGRSTPHSSNFASTAVRISSLEAVLKTRTAFEKLSNQPPDASQNAPYHRYIHPICLIFYFCFRAYNNFKTAS